MNDPGCGYVPMGYFELAALTMDEREPTDEQLANVSKFVDRFAWLDGGGDD